VRRGKRSMVVYLLIAGVMALLFMRLPTSFLPDEDQAFLQVQVTCRRAPRTRGCSPWSTQVQDYFGKQPEVLSVNVITGQNGDQSSARAFVKLKDWASAKARSQSAADLARRANKDLSTIRDARIFVLLPPAVRGLGANAGFNFSPEGHQRPGPRRAGEGARPGVECWASGPRWPTCAATTWTTRRSSRSTSTTRAPAR
jgi:multidrug efflux pump subunit AcrB